MTIKKSENSEMQIIKVGNWWNDKTIELISLKSYYDKNAVFALFGWNGEEYCDCWLCYGEFYLESSKEKLTLRPIYRYEITGIDLDSLEEEGEEWNFQFEIIDYKVSEN